MPELKNATVPIAGVAFGAILGAGLTLGVTLALLRSQNLRASSSGVEEEEVAAVPPVKAATPLRPLAVGPGAAAAAQQQAALRAVAAAPPGSPTRKMVIERAATPRFRTKVGESPLPGRSREGSLDLTNANIPGAAAASGAVAPGAGAEAAAGLHRRRPRSGSEAGGPLARGTSLNDLSLVANQGCLLERLNDASGEGNGVLVVGVAGGTGSGKTTLAKAIRESLNCDISYLNHDNYYKDLRHLSLEERSAHNFDHPDALDTDLLHQDLLKLRRGECVEIPTYDFATHARRAETERVKPTRIILVEGILIFTHEALREAMDIKIFVDTADDVRLIRRMTRDMNDRGRSPDGVIKQYMKTVRPMHLKFVEPSKQHADVIVPVGLNQAALDLIISRLRFASDT